jgi:hypothetical protein
MPSLLSGTAIRKAKPKEKLLSFGTSPEVFLASAREWHEEARTQVVVGIDPSISRKKGKEQWSGQGTFEAVAPRVVEPEKPWLVSYGLKSQMIATLIMPEFCCRASGRLSVAELCTKSDFLFVGSPCHNIFQ